MVLVFGLFETMISFAHAYLNCPTPLTPQRLLPDQSYHHYNLRNRRHQLQLTSKTKHINNKLFIIRQLFKDTY